ncbi:MAG TPA: tetratricopeptide repeat protein [Candidatus Acidoferrales bacterium]|nr:tetratricopeptide repeat protein [Candidatus Acidoferrales bacterium]
MRNLFANLFGKQPPNQGSQKNAESESLATFKKGDLIGGEYVIYKFLGKGGFGEVYLAYDIRAGSLSFRALKTIRTDLLADAVSREAFKREALLWVNLEEHPFILVARHVFEFSRRLFVGMDYIAPDARGRVSLADHLAGTRGPLDTEESLKWSIQFCYGMEHAFERGIKCHRDIKPTNILITQDGILKISDFGLALAAQAAWKEEPGSVVTEKHDGSFGLSLLRADGTRVCGTPGYIAPEIVLGSQADVRSDIYSFGLVMWQMAKGSPTPPFHVSYNKVASIEEYLHRVLDRQLKKRIPDVGSPMQSAIERCLAPEPSKRYASFEELRRELDQILCRCTGRVIEPPETEIRTLDFWNEKGISLDELGRHEEAIACYDKALKIDPQGVNTWNNKGIALKMLGRYEEAIVCYNKALEIHPDSATVWLCRSNALWGARRSAEAISCLAKALEIDPRLTYAWSTKGQILYQFGRHEEALNCFDKAIDIEPLFARAWYFRSFALKALGRLEEAAVSLTKAEEIDPQCEDDLKQHLAAQGDCGAAPSSEKPLEVAPDNVGAWNDKAIALKSLGAFDAAILCFDAALEIEPRNPALLANKGATLREAGRLEEALLCYDKAVEIDPQSADAWNNKAAALAAVGRFREAADCFEKVFEIDSHPK